MAASDGGNLWNAGAMDELATGIDLATLMGDNIAALVVRAWKREGNFPPPEKRIPPLEAE